MRGIYGPVLCLLKGSDVVERDLNLSVRSDNAGRMEPIRAGRLDLVVSNGGSVA
jgi:hypothetical protein